MSLKLENVTFADRAEIANIITAANWADPYGQTVWPPSTNPFASRVAGSYARLPMSMLSPNTWFMKATNDKGKAVSYAQWTLPASIREAVVRSHEGFDVQSTVDETQKKEFGRESDESCDAEDWPKGCRRDVVESVSPAMKRANAEIFPGGKGEYIMLNQIKTLPEFQRQGAGQLLLAWGVQLADSHAVKICLEATPFGLSLYDRFGFESRAVVEHDVSMFGGPASYKHTLMVREPKKELEV